MNITINGKQEILGDTVSLEDLIKNRCPHPDRVIAELNEQIVKRGFWKIQQLKEGDRLELITFVGGG